MASPSTTDDLPIARLAVGLDDDRRPVSLGGAARAGQTMARHTGVGLTARRGEPSPGQAPSGAWGEAGTDPVPADPRVAAIPALAAYAATLRAKRGDTDRPVRGLPLVAARARATSGPSPRPGGLAARLAPEQHVVPADVTDAVVGRQGTAPPRAATPPKRSASGPDPRRTP